MSDIEDGEVISSDDENKCNVEQDKESNIILINENKIQINDNNRWNFEQNNIKVEKGLIYEDKHINRHIQNENIKDSDSEGNYNDNETLNQKHRNRDQRDKKMHKHREHNSNKRKRRSDHLNSEVITSIPDDVIPVKRRILCKYYAAGDCKSGSTCFFMHGDFPCKFFHDENATCRAGNNCKFSHNPLSEEMKIVLDGFIHDGKEKVNHTYIIPIANIPTFINDSFLTVNPPRPNCLLPTPINIKPMIISNYDPHYNASFDSFNNDFNNKYESFTHLYREDQCFSDASYIEPPQILNKQSIFDGDIPNYPIANKSQFNQNILHIPEIDYLNHDHRIINRFSGSTYLGATPIFQKPLHNSDILDDDHFKLNNVYSNEFCQFSNDENTFPQIFSEKVNLSSPSFHKQINYMNQAPARFIVGNLSSCIKTEPETQSPKTFDLDFRNALKKLAEQIVVDSPQQSSPNLKNSSFDEAMAVIPEVNSSFISHITIKTEASEVRIDEKLSIFKHENDMSESEKNYIQEMKSLINLDAQFENIIPWKLQKLHPTKKQPYTLFKLNVQDIHDNPLADPRLNGHPILNYFYKKEDELSLSNDVENYNEIFCIKEELSVDQSEESDPYTLNNNFHEKKLFESMF